MQKLLSKRTFMCFNEFYLTIECWQNKYGDIKYKYYFDDVTKNSKI